MYTGISDIETSRLEIGSWQCLRSLTRHTSRKTKGALQGHLRFKQLTGRHLHFFPSERETHSRGSTPLRCSCIIAPLHTREAAGWQGLSIGADEKPTISIGDLNIKIERPGWCGQNFAMLTSETRPSLDHHSHLFRFHGDHLLECHQFKRLWSWGEQIGLDCSNNINWSKYIFLPSCHPIKQL